MKATLSQLLGSCIRAKRLELGLSQVVFGERCGFYQTYLSRLERGQANPTLNALEVISDALGTTLFDLFDQVRAESSQEGAKRKRKTPGRPSK